MTERWLTIPGLPLYEVSDEGRVRSRMPLGRATRPVDIPRLLKPIAVHHGYRVVRLRRPGEGYRNHYVHRLVLECFEGAPEAGQVTRHLDGDTSRNLLSNLSWGTQAENNLDKLTHGTQQRGERAGGAKLQPDDVRAIRADPRLQRTIAADYAITQSTVSDIKRRRRWRHLAEAA